MSFRRSAFAILTAAALASPALGAESGQFVVRLGRDTTSVERYERTPSQLLVSQVGRAPRVLRRQFTYDYAGGLLSHLHMVVTAPANATPTQTIDGTVDGDSLRLQITSPQGSQTIATAVPKDVLVVPSTSPWTGYESAFMKLAAGKADSLRGTMLFLGSPSTDWYVVRRFGRDSMTVATGHLDVFRARVDKTGRILGMRPISGTGKFSVERVEALDLDGLAASFASAEHSGTGLGMLSPRDTVRAENAGGAALWIDYGRPGKRGRDLFGVVVPYGEVWRTGANAATQFRTDKSLDFGGGVVVPAGFYTLWSLPTADGWTLIVNSQTGQWGTQHDPAKDLYRIPLVRSVLPEVAERFTISVAPSATGGELRFDWDTTRGSAAFTVKP